VKALKSLLPSLSHINPDGWEAIPPLALFAYCCSAFHNAPGDKPFYLEHGRNPVMPGNQSLGLQNRRNRYDNHDLWILRLSFSSVWNCRNIELYECKVIQGKAISE